MPLQFRYMYGRRATTDLSRMRTELTRLAGRMSELAVEHSHTQRRRDQVVVDLYRAGVDPEEIADLAHLTPRDVRHLAQHQGVRPSRRNSGASGPPHGGPLDP